MKATKLSESDAFGTAILVPLGSYINVHVVPEGEKHLVTIQVTNTDNTNTIELFGHMGAGSNVLDQTFAPESTNYFFKEVMLIGPSLIALQATQADRMRVIGSIKIVD